MSFYNEIERLKKEEAALQARIDSLKGQEESLRQPQSPMTDNAREEQANAVAAQRALLEAKLAETTQAIQIRESALELNIIDEYKNPSENRGEIDTQQEGRDKIAERHEEEKEKIETKVGAVEEISKPLEKLNETNTEVGITTKPIIDTQQLDPATTITTAFVAGSVLVANQAKEIIENIKEKFSKKDAAKEWEKDIAEKEQAANKEIDAKFDKEIKDTEKSLEKQLDYLDKKYQNQEEKENKKEALKETIEKVKEDIEKDREEARKNSPDIQEINKEKEALQKAMEATKNLESAEREKVIQEQRKEFEKQQELEKQRKLEEQNRNGR